jgi:hypothetical protein
VLSAEENPKSAFLIPAKIPRIEATHNPEFDE